MDRENNMCVCARVCVCVCVYTPNGILLSYKKGEILLFVTTRMDLECIMLSEINQMENNKYHIISLMFSTNKQKQNK